MLRPKSPQGSFFVSGSYLYDRIVPATLPGSRFHRGGMA
jgi:hypothetical protein